MADFALDRLDFRILRELFLGDLDFLRSDRVPLDTVARRLEVHRNTVTTRVRRMRQNGVYLPMSVGINSPAVGLVMGMAFVKVPASRRSGSTVEGLFRLGGVSNVFMYLDGWHVLLHAPTRERLESLREEVQLATGAGEAQWDFFLQPGPGMPPPGPLSLPEARIIGALYRDSRESFAKIGERLSITARTAENLYHRLRSRGVIFQTPGQVTGYPGMNAAYLKVELAGTPAEQEAARGAVLKVVANDFVRMLGPVGPISLYIYANSIGELEEEASEVQGVPGVERVDLRILVRKRANPNFPDWIEEQLIRWAAQGRTPSGRPGASALVGPRP